MDSEDEAVARFVADQIDGCGRGFWPCRALGFRDAEGRLEAGFVYHNWSPEAGVIEISGASTHRGWATPEKLRAIMAYPFSFARMVVWRTSERNRVARRILRSMGAREFVIPDLRGPGEAEVIYTLTAEQWRASKFWRDVTPKSAAA